MTNKKLATALGVSARTVSACIAKGMPTSSVSAARRWREANLSPTQTKQGRSDGNAGIAAAPAATNSDLLAERVLSERTARMLRQLELEEKRGTLVNIQQLEAGLQQCFSAFRAEVLAMGHKLGGELTARYGLPQEVVEVIDEYARRTLEHLAAYSPSTATFDAADEGTDDE